MHRESLGLGADRLENPIELRNSEQLAQPFCRIDQLYCGSSPEARHVGLHQLTQQQAVHVGNVTHVQEDRPVALLDRREQLVAKWGSSVTGDHLALVSDDNVVIGPGSFHLGWTSTVSLIIVERGSKSTIKPRRKGTSEQDKVASFSTSSTEPRRAQPKNAD